MKTKKVILRKNLPSGFPLFKGLTAWLALDHFNAPQWMYGAAGLLFLIHILSSVYHLIGDEEIDIFKDKE